MRTHILEHGTRVLLKKESIERQKERDLLSELKYLALAGVSSGMNLNLGSLQPGIDWFNSRELRNRCGGSPAATIDAPHLEFEGSI